MAGLAQGGVDLGAADFILGTSAGAFVGARLALGAETASLTDSILADAVSSVRPTSRATAPPDMTKVMRLMILAQDAGRDPTDVFVELGALALAAATSSEDEFIASFGGTFGRLAPDAWPERGFACTAVDTATGEFQLWTKDSGVGVARAVASSCSVPGVYPPITLKDRRWMDGGVRSSTNADLAIGHDVVVILGLRLSDSTPGGALARMFARLDEEIASLKAGGAEVIALLPNEASRAAMGGNLMDFRKRPDAAHAGLAQGLAAAADLAKVWG